MNLFLRLFTLLAFLTASSGCAVLIPTHHHHGKSRSTLSSSSGKKKSCHPSQYWDGAICRHKGKGKGARKHDG